MWGYFYSGSETILSAPCTCFTEIAHCSDNLIYRHTTIGMIFLSDQHRYHLQDEQDFAYFGDLHYFMCIKAVFFEKSGTFENVGGCVRISPPSARLRHWIGARMSPYEQYERRSPLRACPSRL